MDYSQTAQSGKQISGAMPNQNNYGARKDPRKTKSMPTSIFAKPRDMEGPYYRGDFEPLKDDQLPEEGEIWRCPHALPWEFPNPPRNTANCHDTTAGPTYAKYRFFVVLTMHPGNTHMTLLEIDTNGGKPFHEKYKNPLTHQHLSNMCYESQLAEHVLPNPSLPRAKTLLVEDDPDSDWELSDVALCDLSRPYPGFPDNRSGYYARLTLASTILVKQAFFECFQKACGMTDPIFDANFRATMVNMAVKQALQFVFTAANAADVPHADMLAQLTYGVGSYTQSGFVQGAEGDGQEHYAEAEAIREGQSYEDGYFQDDEWNDSAQYTGEEFGAYLDGDDNGYYAESHAYPQGTENFADGLALAAPASSQSTVAAPSSPPVHDVSDELGGDPTTPRPKLSSSVTGNCPSTPISPADQSDAASTPPTPSGIATYGQLQRTLNDFRYDLDFHDPRFDADGDFPGSGPVSTVDAHIGSIDQNWGSGGNSSSAPFLEICPPNSIHEKHSGAQELFSGEINTLRTMVIERFVYLKAKEMHDERGTAPARQVKGEGGDTGTNDGTMAALRLSREQEDVLKKAVVTYEEAKRLHRQSWDNCTQCHKRKEASGSDGEDGSGDKRDEEPPSKKARA